jgi:hypothetical protein
LIELSVSAAEPPLAPASAGEPDFAAVELALLLALVLPFVLVLLLVLVVLAAEVDVDLAGDSLAVVVVVPAAVDPELAWVAVARVAVAGAPAVVAVEGLSLAAAGAAAAGAAAAAGSGAGACAAVVEPDELDPHAETIRARLAHTGTANTARLTRKLRNVFSFNALSEMAAQIQDPCLTGETLIFSKSLPERGGRHNTDEQRQRPPAVGACRPVRTPLPARPDQVVDSAERARTPLQTQGGTDGQGRD